jgi:hypothetical protein
MRHLFQTQEEVLESFTSGLGRMETSDRDISHAIYDTCIARRLLTDSLTVLDSTSKDAEYTRRSVSSELFLLKKSLNIAHSC